jgi:hypothetical protein
MVVWEEILALVNLVVIPPLIPLRLRATITLHARHRTNADAGCAPSACTRRQRSNGTGTSIGASSGEGASS